MARAPSARISKTVGQGISRGAYQTSRRLSGADASDLKAPQIGRPTPASGGGGVASGKREYAKSAGEISAGYTNREMKNPNLGELKGFLSGKPAKPAKGFVL